MNAWYEYERNRRMIELEDVFCPFAEDGKCRSQCRTARTRACINGTEDDVKDHVRD